jgi:TRAP-type C4-dicarboxylate transport system substrate-binding protein
MAIDKKAFDKIDAEDQVIVREVMTRMYKNFDKVNLVDNKGAFDALVKAGIKPTKFDDDEFIKVRDLVLVSNLKLGAEGAFTLEFYEEMLRHIDEYRSEHVAVAE